MSLLDWLIVIIPLAILIMIALHSRKYIKGVVDYLSAGRLCGRYILLVGDMANGISILSIVMICEQQLKCGFAVSIWTNILIPITLTLSLFGYCVYRFRETRAQSFGEFIELRYQSRSLRVFTSGLRTLAELLAHAIMPAIAGRFFLYYLGFPSHITFLGVRISVFVLIMAVCISLAVFIICCGGTLSIVITDAFQGMLCLPLIVFFTAFLLCKFSWSHEIAPVLMDRAPGESFINPYDVLQLREFNLLTLLLSIVTTFLHAASWIGGGTTGAATSPHEQRMASIMGKWRSFFSPLLYLMLSLTTLVVLNHQHFSKEAHEIRRELSINAASAVIESPELREKFIKRISALPEQVHRIGIDAPLSESANLDTVYLDTASDFMLEEHLPQAAYLTQQFKTLYRQTMMTVTIRRILSPGLIGLFCLLAVLAMLSTDDSYIFSSVITIVQDIIIPFFKKAPSPRLHIWLFRIVAIALGLLFLFCSTFMAQLDYIMSFITIVLSTWLGGCGPVCIFGLYGKFGNKHGAWASVLSGMLLSLAGIILQRTWPGHIYPWLERQGLLSSVDSLLQTLSRPFHPVIDWKAVPDKFPINSFEIYLFTMLFTLFLYIAVSCATRGSSAFDLNKMLHRNSTPGAPSSQVESVSAIWRRLLDKIAGISPEHTVGDKWISYSMVIYSYVYQFIVCLIVMVAWNAVSPWTTSGWSVFFLWTQIIIPSSIVAITGVWFSIGGIYNLRSLFTNLANRTVSPDDNGIIRTASGQSSEQSTKEVEKQ